MPITDDVYSVYLDGRPTERGLTRAKADAYANYLANGIEGKKANDKRRAPCIEVKLDKAIIREDDRLYQWAKHGG